MTKHLVIDTNVFINDPQCLFKFSDNNIYITEETLVELDRLKTHPDYVGYSARETIKILESLLQANKRIKNIQCGKSTLTILRTPTEQRGIEESGDPVILKTAMRLNSTLGQEERVTIISNDVSMRIQAIVMGLIAEEYKNSPVIEMNELYTGNTMIEVEDEIIDKAYLTGQVDYDEKIKLYPNQVVILKSYDNEKKIFVGKYKKGKLIRCNLSQNPSGIVPRNLEQKIAIDLLMDDDIKVVTLSGTFGTSKSFLSLGCALDLYDKKKFDRILIIRPPLPLSKYLNQGFVKGSQHEKAMANMGAITSNLENLKEKKSRMTGEDILLGFLEQKAIDLIDVSRILGSSFKNKLIIVDEAQGFEQDEMRAILSRIGEDSRMFITSDLKQQSINQILPEETGVFRLIDKLKESEYTAHLTLKSIQRSEFVASLEKYW